jgi:hypothetical protein
VTKPIVRVMARKTKTVERPQLFLSFLRRQRTGTLLLAPGALRHCLRNGLTARSLCSLFSSPLALRTPGKKSRLAPTGDYPSRASPFLAGSGGQPLVRASGRGPSPAAFAAVAHSPQVQSVRQRPCPPCCSRVVEPTRRRRAALVESPSVKRTRRVDGDYGNPNAPHLLTSNGSRRYTGLGGWPLAAGRQQAAAPARRLVLQRQYLSVPHATKRDLASLPFLAPLPLWPHCPGPIAPG